MRGDSKKLVAGLVVLLLATGVGACGGGGDSSSTGSVEAGRQDGSASIAAGTTKDKAESGDDGKGGQGGNSDSSGSESAEAAGFTPKRHTDSGGGSAQYVVKGGDNSVQELGEEASASEFDAAATALHNFLDARAEGNWAATCEYMSKELVKSIEELAARGGQGGGLDCARILEKVISPAAKPSMSAEAADADVGSLRVEGSHSFVIYTATHKAIFAMPMADEGGAWKVASLSAVQLN